jgi:hypothetical protein
MTTVSQLSIIPAEGVALGCLLTSATIPTVINMSTTTTPTNTPTPTPTNTGLSDIVTDSVGEGEGERGYEGGRRD